jgi:hypothetical protein
MPRFTFWPEDTGPSDVLLGRDRYEYGKARLASDPAAYSRLIESNYRNFLRTRKKGVN